MLNDPHVIADLCVNALSRHAAELDREHAVYGLDAAKEIQVHEILELGLSDSGLGLTRESPYPGSGDPQSRLSARTRCDLVLTPHPHSKLSDPVTLERERAQAQQTLFAHTLDPIATKDPDACDPQDAMWIEIKTIAQHTCRDGVYTPNASYAHELTHGLCADVAKLASDEHIYHAAVMLAVFTESDETSERDIHTAVAIASSKGLPVRSPVLRTFPITDRGGNSSACVALIPVAC